MYKKKILLTGGRAPATLHLARLLKQQCCTVMVAETFSQNITAASNFVDQKFTIPSPVKHPKQFSQVLSDILQREKIDLLMPTCEETFHIALHAPKLSAYSSIFCPSIEVLDQLHNKYYFNQLLGKLQLPQVKSYLLQNYSAVSDSLAQLPQFVLKAVYSRFANDVIINDDAYRNQSKLWDRMNISIQSPWLAQAFIPGIQLASFSIVNGGKITAHAVYPMAGRIKNGASTYFESTPIPAIKKIVDTIVQELNIQTAFLSFDFIRSDIDGAYYAIECNPRLTSGIHLFQALERIWDYTHGTSYPKIGSERMLAMANFLFHLPLEIRLDNWMEVVSKLVKAKDVVFSWKDISPFFRQFGSLLHFWQISRTKNISLTAASTEDIEWNGSFNDKF